MIGPSSPGEKCSPADHLSHPQGRRIANIQQKQIGVHLICLLRIRYSGSFIKCFQFRARSLTEALLFYTAFCCKFDRSTLVGSVIGSYP